MRFIYSAIIICLFCGLSYAQQNDCANTLQDAPVIRGFRIGMTLEEVKARLNTSKNPTLNETTWATWSLPKSNLRFEEDKQGLNQINFGFVNNSLVAIGIEYDNTYTWNDTDEFMKVVYGKIGLREVNKTGISTDLSAIGKDKPSTSLSLLDNPFSEADSFGMPNKLSGSINTAYCTGFNAIFALSESRTGILVIKRTDIDEMLNKIRADKLEKQNQERQRNLGTFKP